MQLKTGAAFSQIRFAFHTTGKDKPLQYRQQLELKEGRKEGIQPVPEPVIDSLSGSHQALTPLKAISIDPLPSF